LQTEIVIPEHAEVANAVGAIGSEIVVREEVIILPGKTSCYILHGVEEVLEFSCLDTATQEAIDSCREKARQRAVEAGAVAPKVAVTHSDQTGSVANGSRIFLERRVTAVASGGAFGRSRKQDVL
jgi:N-methylhydantoinase A/oxoprolinase/acetone carboxylase beta subunit